MGVFCVIWIFYSRDCLHSMFRLACALLLAAVAVADDKGVFSKTALKNDPGLLTKPRFIATEDMRAKKNADKKKLADQQIAFEKKNLAKKSIKAMKTKATKQDLE